MRETRRLVLRQLLFHIPPKMYFVVLWGFVYGSV